MLPPHRLLLLKVHPFQQFRFDRDAPDVVEERALDLGAVDGDVELRIFQTANVDLLGDTNGAADRDRRRAAEEVTQDAFIRAFTFLDRYDADRPFYPWLAAIAVSE